MSDNDRYAMLVGVSTYDSDAYHDLPAVRADLHYMQAVLQRTEIGMYNDCAMVPEPTRAEMLHAVDSFLEDRQASETALLYFSGHGEFCEDDNQLYFLTRDSDPADLPGTAVPSSFLERTLQSCRASSKVVLLDCCSSGSVVQGWTSKGGGEDGGDRPAPSTLLRPTGVYFITASDALQAASAMAPAGSALGTSRFTGEIVEGLRTGRIKHDSSWITPDDLFTYLTSQMVRNGVPAEQRPTKSTIRATGNLPFARSVARQVQLPAPPAGPRNEAADNRSPALFKARELARLDARDGVDPERLLRYYAHCLGATAAAGMLPDRDTGRNSKYFLLHSTAETIQAGLAESLPAPSKLPRPKKRAAGGPGAPPDNADALQEYWYGYPAVTLPVATGSGRGRTTARIAPLLIQPMELVPDENGRDRLRPAGVPALHTNVVTELLEDDDAADLLARWQPTWQEGNSAQMVQAVRELLSDLGLPELEPLDASVLREQSVMTSLRPGAHNAAVLLTPSGMDRVATDGLVDNLLQISTRTGQIPGTALAALLEGTRDRAHETVPRHVVTPGRSNESQELVVASAMTLPLTVATGPPGTGKSEVVTAVVATAVAAGQSVLVASTNNEAVNVVAERCDAIAPGLLMRTGNSEARIKEAEKLERLLTEPPRSPSRSAATIAGELRNARAQADSQRAEATRLVSEEGRLLELVQDREQRAASLEIPVPVLTRLWNDAGDAASAEWRQRARRVAEARWIFPRLRRARALAALEGHLNTASGESWQGRPHWLSTRPVPPELLDSLSALLTVEEQVRSLMPRHLAQDDEELKQRRQRTTEVLRDLSTELIRSQSAETLLRARTLMEQRLQTLRNKRGNQRSQRNLLPHIKGWAISTHSVRQLELLPKLFDLVVIDEASQCSIPSVLPLLFRARRALVIGDPMQLGHIPGVSPQQERQARLRTGLSAAQLEDRRLTYHVHSSYHAAAQSGEAALLLDEHYRCHPEIANVVNGYCYAGQLQVMTDVRRQIPALDPVGKVDPAPVLGWVDVPGATSARGPRGTSWRNDAEARAVRALVVELLTHLPEEARIGVVTPFRAQKEVLETMLPHERVRVGTVHAFQGGQRDVMVLSPVATLNTPQPTAHWVASQVNLWNVAITRAKSQLITVGSHDFWQGHAGLPALLAHRSAVLRRAAQETWPGASDGPAQFTGDQTLREELTDRLQHHLGSQRITSLERNPTIGGHSPDLLFTERGENTAVLIDCGPPTGTDPARHLRLTLARGDLLAGLPSGGHGAEPAPVSRAVRIPAWRILASEESLGTLTQ
ncbi:AAA domain-containing protein [Streptomyces sp. IB2014 016-6]|uniref:caspase, EACC1-associated type n=1 Tax=Streptomyces sp. IB2014 016-6 TaxID=2517818 RepID=UPI0011C869AD|nr:AAA domain-containing protein [Streptomyces sp. IB2014 016-6]TXL84233.1 peptidase C14 [Streptomyces sp. IB2014 016-6]